MLVVCLVRAPVKLRFSLSVRTHIAYEVTNGELHHMVQQQSPEAQYQVGLSYLFEVYTVFKMHSQHSLSAWHIAALLTHH